MQIDWTGFTPWTSLAGGLLIGAGVALLVLLGGRVAGISGIVGGLLRPAPGETGWRLVFLLGLIGAPLVWSLFGALPEVRVEAGLPTLLLAGLLVGLGTRYGAGCTSGHGICGMARGAPRSIAATAAFMASGFLTVWLLRHVFAGVA
jgi:uncharacterized membrane protein YedE/YeeE